MALKLKKGGQLKQLKKEIRLKIGKISKAAEILGTTEQTISYHINGKRNIGAEMIEKYRAAGISEAALKNPTKEV